jgi:hypothetical protein
VTNLTKPGPVDKVRKAVDNFSLRKIFSEQFLFLLRNLFYFKSRSVRKVTCNLRISFSNWMLRCQKAIIIVSDPANAITIAISVPLSKII